MKKNATSNQITTTKRSMQQTYKQIGTIESKVNHNYFCNRSAFDYDNDYKISLCVDNSSIEHILTCVCLCKMLKLSIHLFLSLFAISFSRRLIPFIFVGLYI